MSTTTMELQVRPRGKPIKSLPETITISKEGPLSDLYTVLAKKAKQSVHRLRITKGSDGSAIPNEKDNTIYSTGLRDQSTIYVKDLGPQIAWKTVFLIEYIGPILFHMLFWLLRTQIYPNAPAQASEAQQLIFYMVVAHFAKRELETLFVHRFSNATMPFFNVFKNSGHYWLLSGLNLAAWVYAPSSPTAKPINPVVLYTGLALFIVGELGNLQTHIYLRSLRSAGGSERQIPRGPLFNIVTCPNYMMETFAWIGVYLVSNFSWSVMVFLVPAYVQMALWGKKKEKRYRREFGDKYKKHRFASFPGVY